MMKHSFKNDWATHQTCAFAIALLGVFAATLNAQVTYQLLVREGESQPGGLIFTDLESAPAINNAGQVLFRATIGTSTEGLWLRTGDQLTTIAIEDGDVPGIPDAKFDSFSSGLRGTVLADDGRVLFAGLLKGSGITSSNDLTLWAGYPGSLQLVMREGSPAPGLPGQNFREPSTVASFNTYDALLLEGGTLGFAADWVAVPNAQHGIWVGTADGGTAPAIRSGLQTPHGPLVQVYDYFGLAPNGDAYVLATTGTGLFGLWRGNAGSVTRLFARGESAPGAGGAVFSSTGFGSIFFFAPNLLSFTAQLDTPSGVRNAYFSGPSGAVSLALLEGTAAPGVPGQSLRAVENAFANQDGGRAAACSLQLVSGVTSANDQLLYYIPPGASLGQWQLIGREGDPVPGISNAFWGSGFSGDFVAINSSGVIAFRNTLTGSGVTSNTDGSLWVWDPGTRALTLVAREGTPIDFGNGNVRTPLILSFRGGQGRPAGRTSGLNNSHELVFEALGSDFNEMIGVARFRPSLQLTSAVSRKLHGTFGPFDVPLPLTGGPAVECRSSGGAHALIFTFSNSVVAGSASVTAGVGSVSGSPTFSGNTMTVNLAGVADVQRITLVLSGITDVHSQVLTDTALSMKFLRGDVSGDGTVNSGDALVTKNRSGQNADATTFRSDVNVDGTVNVGDALNVRAASGNTVP